MGFAEITPGISGATIAGLFNVYKDFVSALTAFNPKNIFDKNEKFISNLKITFDATRCDEIYSLCTDQEALENTTVTDFQELFTLQNNNF